MKTTLTFNQLKKLLRESEDQEETKKDADDKLADKETGKEDTGKEDAGKKEVKEAVGGESWKVAFYKASEGWGWDDDKMDTITINSLADLKKLAETDNCGKLVIDFNDIKGYDADVMLYDTYIE